MKKERPILFSAPMVRAILDGSKTQTRRVVSITPPLSLPNYYSTGRVLSNLENQPGAFMEFRHTSQDEAGFTGSPAAFLLRCPYGKPGDRLWVRETWATHSDDDHLPPSQASKKIRFYRAEHGQQSGANPRIGKWRPSIHMPRWHSRILLEIVSVRVERLNDICEADAISEGIWKTVSGCFSYGDEYNPSYELAVDAFRGLWESINGAGSWAANPWVWVVEFKPINA